MQRPKGLSSCARFNLYHAEVCVGRHPPGPLAPPTSPRPPPSSFSLSDPPHHIFTFHACVLLSCVRPTPGHCQLYVKFQESIPTAIGCKCSELPTADRQNCTFYRDVLRAEQSTTQPRPDSLPNKYLDQYQAITRAVSSLVRDPVSQRLHEAKILRAVHFQTNTHTDAAHTSHLQAKNLKPISNI